MKVLALMKPVEIQILSTLKPHFYILVTSCSSLKKKISTTVFVNIETKILWKTTLKYVLPLVNPLVDWHPNKDLLALEHVRKSLSVHLASFCGCNPTHGKALFQPSRKNWIWRASWCTGFRKHISRRGHHHYWFLKLFYFLVLFFSLFIMCILCYAYSRKRVNEL